MQNFIPMNQHLNNPSKNSGLYSNAINIVKKLTPIRKELHKKQSLEDNQFDSMEVLGSVICGKAFISVYEDAAVHIEPWIIVLQEGGIIQNFGSEVDHLLNKVEKNFTNQCGIFKNTTVFSKRKNLLLEEVLFCLQIIFEKQVQKLKELSFRIFNEMLSKVPITEKVENDVKATIKISAKVFSTRASFLKPVKTKTHWSYLRDLNTFKDSIRQTATEKLQMARLQGIYFKKAKNPINLSFHYLHPHPFGKDSRFDPLSSKDPVNYNSQASKKAGLMRQTVLPREFSTANTESSQKNREFEELVYQEDPAKSYESGSR